MVEKRKGIGYMIEAIVASLTIFVFAVGSLSSPPQHNWNQFQDQIEAQDVGYVIEESGHMENFLERSETGSMRTAASTLSENLEITGTVQNLPIRRSRIGFHTQLEDIHGLRTNTSEAVEDRCYENNDLEEINSEFPIKRTQDAYSNIPGSPPHGVHLYIADTDPKDPTGFNGEEDYDTLWVDNGTRCQFSSGEGPNQIGEFFFWGNESDPEPGDHYDLHKISDDGDKFIVYNATQVVRFRDAMDRPVNGIDTDTRFDTFNFSVEELDVYSVLVFREQDTLTNTLNTEPENETLLEYLDTGSALFLMDLERNDFNGGFMDLTGMHWMDIGWTSRPSKVDFSDNQDSEDVETYFLAQEGNDDSVSILPGGNISSGNSQTMVSDEKLAFAGTGEYSVDDWNATNMSMNPDSDPMPGTTEGCSSSSSNNREGRFEFPEDEYRVMATELGESSCEDIWGLSIDLNQNGQIDNGEGPFVTGEILEVDNREYSVIVYPDSRPDCDEGECAEFVFQGSNRIELVNYRTEFEDREIRRFARAEYQSNYTSHDRRLLTSTIYWLSGDETSFGKTESSRVSTSVVGGIKNNIYMPYKVSMRWKK